MAIIYLLFKPRTLIENLMHIIGEGLSETSGMASCLHQALSSAAKATADCFGIIAEHDDRLISMRRRPILRRTYRRLLHLEATKQGPA